MENQAKLIEFHKVGLDKKFRYEEVAKDIADKVKEIENDEARLPRHLTFHLSIESKRQAAAKKSISNAIVKCTNEECTNIADYDCQVCHEHALCRPCYRANAKELHRCYRTIRPCTYSRKNAHTKCMKMVEVGKSARTDSTDPVERLACDTCRGLEIEPTRPAFRWTGTRKLKEKPLAELPSITIRPGKPTRLI